MVIRDSGGQLRAAVVMRAPSLLSVLAVELYAIKVGLELAADAFLLPARDCRN